MTKATQPPYEIDEVLRDASVYLRGLKITEDAVASRETRSDLLSRMEGVRNIADKVRLLADVNVFLRLQTIFSYHEATGRERLVGKAESRLRRAITRAIEENLVTGMFEADLRGAVGAMRQKYRLDS